MLLALFLFAFIAISFFNHPAIDDYWSANEIVNHGRLGAVKHLYETVSGRYFSNFLMSVCNTLPEGNVWIFKVWPALTIILLWLAFFYFFKSLFKEFAKPMELILASLAFVAVHISNMRSLFEGLYWMSSAIIYQIAIISFLVGIAAIRAYWRKPSFHTAGLALFFSAVLPGTSELLTPIYLLALLLILLIAIKENLTKYLILSCIVVVSTGMVITLTSEGNHHRINDDALNYSQSISFAVGYSFLTVSYYFLFWIVNILNFSGFLLLLPFLKRISIRVANVLKKLRPLDNIFLFTAFALSVCMCVYIPLYYIESRLPFPRVTTMLFFIGVFLFCIFICSLLYKSGFVLRLTKRLLSVKNFNLYSWILFLIALFSSRNFLAVSADLVNGTAYQYNQEYFGRYEEIRKCKSDTCYVTPFKHWLPSIQLFQAEIRNDGSFNHMDKFFGKTITYKK